MTDYEDYENNLAFPPTTDRTQSTIELVEKNRKLTKWLDLKSEYIEKLEAENKWYSEQLNEAVKEVGQLKKWCEEFNALDVAKENTQLKELLKECKLAIFNYPPYDLASDKIRLQIKIAQALGEE